MSDWMRAAPAYTMRPGIGGNRPGTRRLAQHVTIDPVAGCWLWTGRP